MVMYCLCRQWQDAQEIMEKVEKLGASNHPFSFRIHTDSGTRNYDAYECRYCGRLQLVRVRTVVDEQELLVTG